MAYGLTLEVEYIPNGDFVFMRAHKAFFRAGVLQPGVYRVHGSGMSVDWEKYSTASATRLRSKVPTENAVLLLSVTNIREIGNLDVTHTPAPENPAHSDVFGLAESGEDLTEARALLLAEAEILISL